MTKAALNLQLLSEEQGPDHPILELSHPTLNQKMFDALNFDLDAFLPPSALTPDYDASPLLEGLGRARTQLEGTRALGKLEQIKRESEVTDEERDQMTSSTSYTQDGEAWLHYETPTTASTDTDPKLDELVTQVARLIAFFSEQQHHHYTLHVIRDGDESPASTEATHTGALPALTRTAEEASIS